MKILHKAPNCAPSTQKETKKNAKQGFKSKHISPESSENTAFSNCTEDQDTSDICPSCGANFRRNAVICGVNFSFRVMCSCEKEKLKKAEEEQKIREKLHKIRELKALSLFGERYKNASFQSSKTGINPSFDKAFERCKKYCELFERTVKEGYGIYLFGPKGAGKTHLTACMANFLLSKCVPVLFTNLFEISKAVKSTFNRASSQTEQILIEKFSSIDVLFFDDIGSEIFSKNSGDTWLQGLLFDLLNKRYNNQKATIFTSNYSLNQLINERKIMEKTVDRINEMTSGAVIKISGESFRREKSREVIF